MTTADAWDTLTAMERTDRLERLAVWARERHNITDIFVADSTPVLRARVRDGRAELYGAGSR